MQNLAVLDWQLCPKLDSFCMKISFLTMQELKFLTILADEVQKKWARIMGENLNFLFQHKYCNNNFYFCPVVSILNLLTKE